MREQSVYPVTSLVQTQLLGKALGKNLTHIPVPFRIFLKGSLGAGKTTLIKSIISEMASINEASISSPTFQYLALYESKQGAQIAHFDLWRLPQSSLCSTLGFEDVMDSSFSFIEWPEKLGSFYQDQMDDGLIISIEVTNELERTFVLSFPKKYSSLFGACV